MKASDILDELLANYRLWGLTAVSSFIIFIILLCLIIFSRGINFILFVMVLLFGFLWIGATSISRHSFILLKGYIGKKVSISEFLSTQLVVFIFPVAYRKVKKEILLYRKAKSEGKKVQR